MIRRPYWIGRIRESWKRAPIVLLTGVRRVGKTTLAQSFEDAKYINCDLPRNQERLADPEFFYSECKAREVILDEVHQLEKPSDVLKIAADEFPGKRILATGSSTLAATSKFRDSLTGRKRVVLLPPVLATELPAFGDVSLESRLRRGGLPPRVLNEDPDPEFYTEWIDSYYARDVQELFQVSKRSEFLKLIEILIRNNGGLMEGTSLAKQTGLTRPTVMNYLQVLEVTHLIHRLRPFHDGGKREILAQPKIYAFDTGFVCHYRGLSELPVEERGILFENLVLDAFKAYCPNQVIHYWRDKQGREIDYVMPKGGKQVDAIECKWNVQKFEPGNLEVFRKYYPKGNNYVVTASLGKAEKRRFGKLEVIHVPIGEISEAFQG